MHVLMAWVYGFRICFSPLTHPTLHPDAVRTAPVFRLYLQADSPKKSRISCQFMSIRVNQGPSALSNILAKR